MKGLLGNEMDTGAPAPTDQPQQDQSQPGQAPPADPGAPPPDDTGAPPADDTGGGDQLTPQALTDHMHLPPELKQMLDKIVVAGLKVMFDPKTHHLMLDELNKPGPIEQKLGQGVAGLMALLFQQSQRSIPPQLIVPAGIVLMAHAVQFLKEAGQPVEPQQFGAAVHLMIMTLAPAFKVDPAKLDAKAASLLPEEAQPGDATEPGEGAEPGEAAEPPAAPAKPQFKSLMGS